jgi:hypothetical protein
MANLILKIHAIAPSETHIVMGIAALLVITLVVDVIYSSKKGQTHAIRR